MTSWSDPGDAAHGPERGPDEDRRATAELWRRRADHGAPAIHCAAALIGTDQALLADAVAISLAGSPEATVLLDGMETRIRTLKTGVASTVERCVASIRGPVLWAETITARANSLGNDDVFVCAAAERSFDIVENRVLVAALEAIARAGRALRGPLGERVPVDEAARITAVAAEAQRWRDHPRLADLRGGRLTGRDMARLRGGHRLARMAAVTAIRDRVTEPFHPEDLADLADGTTRAYHRLVLTALDVVAARGLANGELTFADDAVRSEGLSFRHPALGGSPGGGLAYRGVALLPPPDQIEGAPWHDDLPSKGITISCAADVERLLDRLAERERLRGRSAPSSSARAQASGASSSSSG
jgi:hypothetical protein